MVFSAKDAVVSGDTLHYEGPSNDDLGFWSDAKDSAAWPFYVSKDGAYSVDILTSCPPGAEGTRYSVTVGGASSLTGTVPATANWTTYQSTSLGMIRLRAGKHMLTIRILDMPHGIAMNLRSITFRP